jgi:hypothetical protein
MDSSKLFGTFRGSTALTLYRPVGNNIYNVDNRVSSFYNTTTTQPTTVHNYLYYNTTGVAWRFRPYQLNGASGVRTPSIYWADVSGSGSVFDTTNACYLTYNGSSGRFVPYQKLFVRIQGVPSTGLDNTKMRTQAIYQLNATNSGAIRATNAFIQGIQSPFVFNSPATTNFLETYLTCDNTGILFQNSFPNRNFFINGSIYISLSSIGNGAKFTFYIFMGNDILAESSMVCKNGQNSVTLFVNTVYRGRVEDVGKIMLFKLKYTAGDATILTTTTPTQYCASIRTL